MMKLLLTIATRGWLQWEALCNCFVMFCVTHFKTYTKELDVSCIYSISGHNDSVLIVYNMNTLWRWAQSTHLPHPEDGNIKWYEFIYIKRNPRLFYFTSCRNYIEMYGWFHKIFPAHDLYTFNNFVNSFIMIKLLANFEQNISQYLPCSCTVLKFLNTRAYEGKLQVRNIKHSLLHTS